MPRKPIDEKERLFVRLYLDRHITPRLAVDLAQQGYDALTTHEAALDTAEDEVQLEYAANQSRALLTYNIADFAELHKRWSAAGRTHAGIIVSRQMANRRYGLLLGRVLRLLNSMSAEEMANNFVHLEQFK